MTRAAKVVVQATVHKGHKRWAPRRAPNSVVRLYRASKAAHVFSEIAKTHIINPLPEQLELAEEDLRAALDELMNLRSDPFTSLPVQLKSPTPSGWGNRLLLASSCGFWAMMLFNALRFWGVV